MEVKVISLVREADADTRASVQDFVKLDRKNKDVIQEQGQGPGYQQYMN